MDAFVLGAEPPYSFLLGGKLVAMLDASNEEQNDARKRRLVQLATALEKRMAFSPFPRCGGATELRSSRYGLFFGCASYRGGNCDGLVNVPRRVLELAVQDLGLTCPRCRGTSSLSLAAMGYFWAVASTRTAAGPIPSDLYRRRVGCGNPK